jgi:hypothetical protein
MTPAGRRKQTRRRAPRRYAPPYELVVDAADRLRDGLTAEQLRVWCRDQIDLTGDQAAAVIAAAERHLVDTAPLDVDVEAAKQVTRLADIYLQQMAIARGATAPAGKSRNAHQSAGRIGFAPADSDDLGADDQSAARPESDQPPDNAARLRALADATKTVKLTTQMLALDRPARAQSLRRVVLTCAALAEEFIPPSSREAFAARIRATFTLPAPDQAGDA